MRTAIDSVLNDYGQVANREQLLTRVSRAELDDEIRRGNLLRLFPRAYVRPWLGDVPDLRQLAAVRSVGGDAALSHLSALARWGLIEAADPLHVTAYLTRHPRGVAGQLVVHRTKRPMRTSYANGIPVVELETSLVNSWPLLTGADQRAPLILAARRRLISPSRLGAVVDKSWWIEQRPQLVALCRAVIAGCESELELWGYQHVFSAPGLDDGVWQREVRAAGRRYRLDYAFEAERLAVELDGRAYHSSRQHWERDIARDLELAKVGWQTIRLSHARLTGDPEGCRSDVLAVRAKRAIVAA